METARREAAGPHRNVFIMNMAAALIWFAMYAYVPTLPAYSASIGADVAAIGMISGAYGIMQMVLRIPLGLLSDRLGKDRALLIAGFSVLTLSAVLFLVTNTVAWVIAARTVAGAAAAWWVIISASFAKYHPEESQVKAQGVLGGAANAGKLAASVGCAFAAQWFGYKATFVLSFAGAALGLILMFGLRDAPAQPARTANLKEQLGLFRNRNLLCFSFLSLISQMHCFALPTTYTPVIAENLGADSMQLGFLVVAFFIAVSASSFFVGSKLYRKTGGIRVLACAFGAAWVSSIPTFYDSLSGIFVMQFLAGVSYGIIQAELAGFVIRCVPAQQRGAATGIFQSLFAIGIFLGPVLAGILIENAGFNAAYWAYAVLSLAAGALCFVLVPKEYSEMT